MPPAGQWPTPSVGPDEVDATCRRATTTASSRCRRSSAAWRPCPSGPRCCRPSRTRSSPGTDHDLGRDDDDVRRGRRRVDRRLRRCSRSPLPPPLVAPTNGTSPSSRLSVTNATISRPTIDRTGASQRPADTLGRDEGADARFVTRRSRPGPGRPGRPGSRPSRDGCPRSRRRGCRAGAIRSRRRRRLVRRATTSSRSPSWTVSAMSARPKAMPSSTSRSRRRVSWLWPPVAARTRVTVRPRTATSGSGLPGPHGASPASSRNRA